MNKFYYHGSDDYLPKGESLRNVRPYEGKWGSAAFYRGLERHRPEDARPHSKSVFMVEKAEDLEYAGGGEEFTFIVKPIGHIGKHDMFWSTMVTSLIDEGKDIDSKEVKEAARKYWEGIPSDNPAWEYTCDKAIILRVYDWDDDIQAIINSKDKLEVKYSKDCKEDNLSL